MREALLLVFANKQDLPGAMSPAEVTEKLGLHRMRDRSWFVHPSCATSGEVSCDKFRVKGQVFRSSSDCAKPIPSSQGLFEGLSWLSANVKKQQN